MTSNDVKSAVSYLYAFLRWLGVSILEDPDFTRTTIRVKPGSVAAWICGLSMFLAGVAGVSFVAVMLVAVIANFPKVAFVSAFILGSACWLLLALGKFEIKG